MRTPPFCPNPLCRNHRLDNYTNNSSRRWYIKSGFYTPHISKIRIQRFICKDCGRHFSDSTFTLNYYAKRHISYLRIMQYLSSGMSIRAISRHIACSPDAINRKIGILARQISILMMCVGSTLELREDLVADGFESFAVNQYFPNNFNILVGKHSQFVYYFNYVQLRRKGRMTNYQKKRADMLKKEWPLPADHERCRFLEIKQKILQMAYQSKGYKRIEVFTDEKKIYQTYLKENVCIPGNCNRNIKLSHTRVSSKKYRNIRNELFPVNYMDREFRKDLAEHHRETTCFARNVNNSVARMIVYLLYHNFFKPFRINRKIEESISHADKAGIERGLYNSLLSHIFTRRLFGSHYHLFGHYEKVWFKAYQTPLKRYTDYIPAYAFA